MTTTWNARLSRDGGRVLCGWTDARDQQTCTGVIGWVIVDGAGVRDVEFQPFYVQERPADPNSEPLPLKITAAAEKKWAAGQLPMPGRRHHRGQVHHRFGLPVKAPCPVASCRRLNLVTSDFLAAELPSA
jgi:hypothetical protein